jgi:hypothetical protein
VEKPDPKDPKYEDRVNLFVKDCLRWERSQPKLPLHETLSEELRSLFTEESLQEAAKLSGGSQE